MGPDSFRCLLALLACYIVALSSVYEMGVLSSRTMAWDLSRPTHHLRRRRASEEFETEFENRVPSHHQAVKHRVAILLPYLGLDVPPYLSLFCIGAAGASSVADFVIPHNGILTNWPGRDQCPDNVVFIDLETTDNMVDLMVSRMLSHKPEDKWAIPKRRLVALISRHLESKPYSMVEYKGALGHIYQEYIPPSTYSHWAYSDFDMLFGDLERHISKDEWEDFDITTYGYGDQDRLFVRGQFTMHKNDPDVVNQLWRPCLYMSEVDARFYGIASGEKYRFESGEGCYSVAILQNTNIAVKYAVRAWSDAEEESESIYSQSIFLTRSENSPGRHVLTRFTKDAMDEEAIGGNIPLLPPDWFEYDKVYQDYAKDLHEPTSALLPIDEGDSTDNCRLGWIQPEYRDKICVPPSVPVTNTTNLYWINGKRYMQHFRLRELEKTKHFETAPYFHFMKLKRNFRENQFKSVLDPSLRSVLLAPQGGIPLLGPGNDAAHMQNEEEPHSPNVPATQLFSPLGVSMNEWERCDSTHDCDVRGLLPEASYCFSGLLLPKKKYGIKCSDLRSWQDPDRVVLVSTAPEWGNVSIDDDVTLTLTVQIEVSEHRESLSQWTRLLNENLRHWNNAPSVVLIHLSVAPGAIREKSIDFLIETFGGSPLTKKSLIAVVVSDRGAVVSRKALLNMAVDAVPTRWYLSGLEVEQGLVVSTTAVERAHHSIKVGVDDDFKEGDQGRVFLVPQFAVTKASLSSNMSMSELTTTKRDGFVHHTWELDKICNADANSTVVRFLDSPYEDWWGHDSLVSFFMGRPRNQLNSELKNLLSDVDRLRDFEESPILLVDNKGPRPGVQTHLLVREVEEFAGRRCFNGLRMAQLAGFGYKFAVLEGAFVVSTQSTREVGLFANDPSLPGFWKCEGCHLFTRQGPDMLAMVDEVAESEKTRPTKTSMLWDMPFLQ